MGVNELKNRKAITTTLKIENAEKLDKLAKETMISKTKLLDQALELLFKKYDVK